MPDRVKRNGRQSRHTAVERQDWRTAMPYSREEWPAIKTEILLRLGHGEKHLALAKEYGIDIRRVRYMQAHEYRRIERQQIIKNELHEQGWRDELASESVRGLLEHAKSVDGETASYNDLKILQGNAKGTGHFKVVETITNFNQQNNLILTEEAAARLLALEHAALQPRVVIETTPQGAADPGPAEHSGPDHGRPTLVVAECDQNL